MPSGGRASRRWRYALRWVDDGASERFAVGTTTVRLTNASWPKRRAASRMSSSPLTGLSGMANDRLQHGGVEWWKAQREPAKTFCFVAMATPMRDIHRQSPPKVAALGRCLRKAWAMPMGLHAILAIDTRFAFHGI